MSHSHSILTAMHSSYINISLFALSLKLIQAAPRLYFCNCDKSCFPSGSCSFQRGLISQVTVLPSFKLESHQTIAGPITDGLYMKHVYNRHAKCQDGNIFLRLFVFPCALFYACVSYLLVLFPFVVVWPLFEDVLFFSAVSFVSLCGCVTPCWSYHSLQLT